VAFAEALEARMALRCCPITRLNLARYDEVFMDPPTGDPGPLYRVCSSPALAKLKRLKLSGLLDEADEVCLATNTPGMTFACCLKFPAKSRVAFV
jgi:hypothetical protein